MSRVRKNRKAGSTAKQSSNAEKAKVKSSRSGSIQYSKKRGKGLAPGSRQNDAGQGSYSGRLSQKRKDPRHGSKKKVSLLAPELDIGTHQRLSPEQELEALEQNPRLIDLLDKLDAGQSISAQDQSWLDQQTERHQSLMRSLGLDEVGDEEDVGHDDGGLSSWLDD